MNGQISDQEICISYKGARNPNEQIQILADLNNVSRTEIICILVKNNVELTRMTVRRLHKRLDQLDARIAKKELKRREIDENRNPGRLMRLENEIEADEQEYRDIAKILSMAKRKDRRADHGERVHGYGHAE